jgi:hypothetical protein
LVLPAIGLSLLSAGATKADDARATTQPGKGNHVKAPIHHAERPIPRLGIIETNVAQDRRRLSIHAGGIRKVETVFGEIASPFLLIPFEIRRRFHDIKCITLIRPRNDYCDTENTRERRGPNRRLAWILGDEAASLPGSVFSGGFPKCFAPHTFLARNNYERR